MSLITQKNKIHNIKRILKITNSSNMVDVVNNRSIINLFNQMNIFTAYTYITCLCVYCRDNNLLDLHSFWLSELIKQKQIIDTYYENKVYNINITLNDIINKFNELSLIQRDINLEMMYLLLALLIHLKPKRCELAEICLINNNKNYIENNKLIMNNFKTSKFYGKIIEQLNDDIMLIINKSLKDYPRDYLLINSKGKPFTHNCYSRFFKTTFKKLFDRDVTVNNWRKYYTLSIDYNNIKYKDLKDVAKNMGHSIETHMTYYKLPHHL